MGSGRNTATATKSKAQTKDKRQLVRWDAELDILLLLTVQSACNITGIKIPWEKIAQLMGPKFTEGAIVQHLSKLRARREAEEKPVPPPLRRSATAIANKEPVVQTAVKEGRRKRKARDCESSSDEPVLVEQEDSDPEYLLVSPRRRKRAAKRMESTTAGGKPQKTKTPAGIKSEKSEEHKYATSDEGAKDRLCVGASFLRFSDDVKQYDDPRSSSPDSKDKPKAGKSGLITIKLPSPWLKLFKSGSDNQSNNTNSTVNQSSGTNALADHAAMGQMIPRMQSDKLEHPPSGLSQTGYENPFLPRNEFDPDYIHPSLITSGDGGFPAPAPWVSFPGMFSSNTGVTDRVLWDFDASNTPVEAGFGFDEPATGDGDYAINNLDV